MTTICISIKTAVLCCIAFSSVNDLIPNECNIAGADRNLPNRFGVYPADSATNAGNCSLDIRCQHKCWSEDPSWE